MEVEIGDDMSSSATTVLSLLPLASTAQQPYVSELLSFTLDRLHKEPDLLRVEGERIQRQMQEVAVGNYRAFITAADALLAIREEVSSIDKHLESMITEIPKLTMARDVPLSVVPKSSTKLAGLSRALMLSLKSFESLKGEPTVEFSESNTYPSASILDFRFRVLIHSFRVSFLPK